MYTGTAGRIENAQVAVYLSYAGRGGHALIDRELHLPASWAGDPGRCRAAGIPATAGFAAKPALARRMITRALDAGVQASWVAGDEVYGGDPQLRAELENRRTGYVLAVSCHHRVTTGAGPRRADELAACLPPAAWQRRSAGPGAKGHRCHDWALVSIRAGQPGQHWLLIRRSRRTRELAFYRCYAPGPVPLGILVTVAGRRWTVEENFQAGKELTGLDQHQVRRWASWYRWVTLAMLAAAFLTITSAAERARHPHPEDQIPLTRNEISRLLTTMISQPSSQSRQLHWPAWRRRHQYRAKLSHYHRQAAIEP